MSSEDEEAEPSANEEQIKQLARVVCICKGINLGRVLRALEGCSTVAEVNIRAGTGSGGCKGERCGPRIRLLLQKYNEAKGSKTP
jgi:hypothetical protein